MKEYVLFNTETYATAARKFLTAEDAEQLNSALDTFTPYRWMPLWMSALISAYAL